MNIRHIADDRIWTQAAEPLASSYQLSPFVWREADAYHMMLRAVNRSDEPANKVARIYHGRSDDGLTFRMDASPAISPGPDAQDRDGCEDPTVVRDAGDLLVYYTGWNQELQRGCLATARGPAPDALIKQGVAVASTPERRNPKEAELVRRDDGTWRLFYEFARNDASLVGSSGADDPSGPWRIEPDPFAPRPQSWDAHHLSPGPTLQVDDAMIMLYNGASKDAKWRVGWVQFDRALTRVLERCDEPVVKPPAPQGDDTDIAFAASAVRDAHRLFLYYSVADQYMRRATLEIEP